MNRVYALTVNLMIAMALTSCTSEFRFADLTNPDDAAIDVTDTAVAACESPYIVTVHQPNGSRSLIEKFSLSAQRRCHQFELAGSISSQFIRELDETRYLLFNDFLIHFVDRENGDVERFIDARETLQAQRLLSVTAVRYQSEPVIAVKYIRENDESGIFERIVLVRLRDRFVIKEIPAMTINELRPYLLEDGKLIVGVSDHAFSRDLQAYDLNTEMLVGNPESSASDFSVGVVVNNTHYYTTPANKTNVMVMTVRGFGDPIAKRGPFNGCADGRYEVDPRNANHILALCPGENYILDVIRNVRTPILSDYELTPTSWLVDYGRPPLRLQSQ